MDSWFWLMPFAKVKGIFLVLNDTNKYELHEYSWHTDNTDWTD